MANQICKVLEGLEFGEIEQIYAFLVGVDGKLFAKPIVNQSSNPREKAVIDISTMAELSDSPNLIAIAHSHPEGGETLSEQDKKFSDAWQIPVIAICGKTKRYESYFPCEFTAERFPLEGRPQVLGFLDCYCLVRDYYFLNYGISLNRNGDRLDRKVSEIDEAYLDRVTPEESPILGDIIVFGRGDSFLHCGIYMGGDNILHQTIGKFSCIEPLSPRLKESVAAIFRLKNG